RERTAPDEHERDGAECNYCVATGKPHVSLLFHRDRACPGRTTSVEPGVETMRLTAGIEVAAEGPAQGAARRTARGFGLSRGDGWFGCLRCLLRGVKLGRYSWFVGGL